MNLREKIGDLLPCEGLTTENTVDELVKVAEDYALEKVKIHVEAALKKASESVFYTTERDSFRNIKNVSINKDSILNAYPTENIK